MELDYHINSGATPTRSLVSTVRVIAIAAVFVASVLPCWAAKQELSYQSGTVVAITPGHETVGTRSHGTINANGTYQGRTREVQKSWIDYAVVSGSTLYVLRPINGSSFVQFMGGWSGTGYAYLSMPVALGAEISIAFPAKGYPVVRDAKGRLYTCLPVSSRLADNPSPVTDQTIQPPASNSPDSERIRTVMKNEDVLRLKDLGFSDELIVQSIKAAKKIDFNLAVDDLAQLRQHGLSEAVLLEMFTAQRQQQ